LHLWTRRSFPTRRSSDLYQLVATHALDGGDVLEALGVGRSTEGQQAEKQHDIPEHDVFPQNGHSGLTKKRLSQPGWLASAKAPRSEEHTSELQSRENLVC